MWNHENYFEEQMKKYPEYYKNLAEKNKHLKDFMDKALKKLPRFKNNGTKNYTCCCSQHL